MNLQVGEVSVTLPHPGNRETIAFQRFAPPFERPPKVLVALNGLDARSDDHEIRLRVEAINVTKEGFEIKFTTWAVTYIAAAWAQWIAIGE